MCASNKKVCNLLSQKPHYIPVKLYHVQPLLLCLLLFITGQLLIILQIVNCIIAFYLTILYVYDNLVYNHSV